jgi:hypothetical protein
MKTIRTAGRTANTRTVYPINTSLDTSAVLYEGTSSLFETFELSSVHFTYSERFYFIGANIKRRDSSIGMTGYELDGLGSIPSRGKIIFSFYSVQAEPAAHPVSYPMGTVGSFTRSKLAAA